MPSTPPVSFERNRRVRVGFSVVVAVAALSAIVIMLNVLAARHGRRFDLSGSNRFVLTPLTEQVLDSLTNAVKVTVLFNATADLAALTTGMLEEYARRCPDRLQLKKVDHRAEPAAANALRGHYKIAADAANVVIFDCDGRTRLVYDTELSEFQADPDFLHNRKVRRAGFKGESLFTSALVSVTDITPVKAYFLRGHGECRPDDPDELFGYLKFARLLAEKNVAWEALELGTPRSEVPADCQLLIVAGPQRPPLEDEVAKLDRYLDQGGRLLLLTHPVQLSSGASTGFEGLLRKWGVVITRAAASDEVYSQRGFNVQTRTFAAHPITAPLSRSEATLVFPSPRAISVLPPSLRTPEMPAGENIVLTSTNGLTKSGLTNGVSYPVPRLDRRGEVPLAAAVEKGGLAGVAANRGATRIVAIGDSQVFGNEYLGVGGNLDFAHLTLTWLLDRSQLLAIGPKPLNEYRLNLTDGQLSVLKTALLAGLPGGVLLLGFGVWFRRRA